MAEQRKSAKKMKRFHTTANCVHYYCYFQFFVSLASFLIYYYAWRSTKHTLANTLSPKVFSKVAPDFTASLKNKRSGYSTAGFYMLDTNCHLTESINGTKTEEYGTQKRKRSIFLRTSCYSNESEWPHYHTLLLVNNNDRLTAFDPGQPG